MRRSRTTLLALTSVTLLSVATVFVAGRDDASARAAGSSARSAPLKEAKLIIEHNATDRDTGFQGFVDGEGWQRLDVRGPRGRVLSIEGHGAVGTLGLTELFFESVEPENADVPLDETLAKLPAGRYTISGPTRENGKSAGVTSGTALLTHTIPAGPVLVSPKDGAVVAARGVVARWRPVTRTLAGDPLTIIAYQLIIEKDGAPHRAMIGTPGLSMYLRPSVTSIAVPAGVLEPRSAYTWEVLAIERSGNQTLSSGAFRTR